MKYNGSPATSRPLPLVFDVVAVFLAVQAHLLSAVTILSSTSVYTSLTTCLLLLAASLAIPLGCVTVARQAGGDLSNRAFRAASCAILLVNIALVAILPPDRFGSPAAWTWGATGVTVLICAAFRSARDVLTLSITLSLLAGVMLAPHLASPGLDLFQVLTTLVATAVPALAAAKYLDQYVRALRSRGDVLAAQTEMQIRATADRLIRQDAQQRLEAVRAELIPLLTSVADGRARIDDTQVADKAKTLGEVLRSELVDARSGRWLLNSPVALAGDQDKDDWPGIILLDPEALLGQILDQDRAKISALLGTLRTYNRWQRVSVALASPESGELVEARAAVDVVATGKRAIEAATDPAALYAVKDMEGSLMLETATVLIVEATVGKDPRAAVSPARSNHEHP